MVSLSDVLRQSQLCLAFDTSFGYFKSAQLVLPRFKGQTSDAPRQIRVVVFFQSLFHITPYSVNNRDAQTAMIQSYWEYWEKVFMVRIMDAYALRLFRNIFLDI